MLNSEAIEYVKKPTEEFIRDSWRLVKRCTKPDRQGARMQSRGASTPAEAEAIPEEQPTGRQVVSSQRAASDSWPAFAAAAAAHRPVLPAFAMHGCRSNGQLGFGCLAAVSGLADAAPYSLRQPELTPPVARVSQSSRRLLRRLRLASRSWASSAFS